jgi:hypothetical protein
MQMGMGYDPLKIQLMADYKYKKQLITGLLYLFIYCCAYGSIGGLYNAYNNFRISAND